MSKFLSRKLLVAVGAITAAILNKQYDAAFGLAAAYVLAQAHVDAKSVKAASDLVARGAADVAASAGDPRFQ